MSVRRRSWSEWFDEKKFGLGVGFGVFFVIVFIGLVIFRAGFVTFVDNYEFGFTYNQFTGKVELVAHNGWIVRNPIVYTVHAIDTRPYQVSISANSRILNAKLVRFNPEGLDTFIEWHGRKAGDQLGYMLDILRCYAFDVNGGKDCPFLTVVNEIAPSQVPPSVKGANKAASK